MFNREDFLRQIAEDITMEKLVLILTENQSQIFFCQVKSVNTHGMQC